MLPAKTGIQLTGNSNNGIPVSSEIKHLVHHTQIIVACSGPPNTFLLQLCTRDRSSCSIGAGVLRSDHGDHRSADRHSTRRYGVSFTGCTFRVSRNVKITQRSTPRLKLLRSLQNHLRSAAHCAQYLTPQSSEMVSQTEVMCRHPHDPA